MYSEHMPSHADKNPGHVLDLEKYPDNVLLHPLTDPTRLVEAIETHGGWQTYQAIVAAHACLEHSNWGHLQKIVDAGFDIAGNHAARSSNTGVEETLAGETLIHRCLRLHLYDELADRLGKLIDMGADPHAFDQSGLSVLGLLVIQSRDLPTHRTRQAFETLEAAGVKMSDPCSNGQGVSRYLVDSNVAPEVIAVRAPELEDWAWACFEREKMAEQALERPVAGKTRISRL